MFNYHELTMSESKSSPAKKKQFIVICAVMSLFVGNMVINAGAFNAVKIEEGKFRGGELVYKAMARDVAAFAGMTRTVAGDASFDERSEDNDDLVYSVFLDVDSDIKIPSYEGRILTGVLGGGGGTKRTLMSWNKEVDLNIPEGAYPAEYNKEDKFGAHILYESGRLPSARAAVSEFTYNSNFVSPLVYQFKVFPALVRYVKEHGAAGSPVVVAVTCSVNKGRCMAYAPLEKGLGFYLGKRPATKDYAVTVATRKSASGPVMGMIGRKKKSSAADKEI